jgi:hypothetical protein
MEEALRETGAEVAAHAADVGSSDGYRGTDILVNNVRVAPALPTAALARLAR